MFSKGSLLRSLCSALGSPSRVCAGVMIKVIAPHTPAESYQNFPNRLITDWQKQYYAENFPRLVQVKKRYDPNNLFQNPQSIPTYL